MSSYRTLEIGGQSSFRLSPGNLLKWRERKEASGSGPEGEDKASAGHTFAINPQISVETVNREDLDEEVFKQFQTEVRVALVEKRKQAYIGRMRARGYFGKLGVVKSDKKQLQRNQKQKRQPHKQAARHLHFDAVLKDSEGVY